MFLVDHNTWGEVREEGAEEDTGVADMKIAGAMADSTGKVM